MTHRDEDSHDVMRGEDLLAALAMRHEVRRPDSSLYGNEDVVNWLDREAAAPERASQHWSAEHVRSVAARIHAAGCARRCKVRQVVGAPPLRAAAAVGTIPQVLQHATESRAAPRLELSAAAGLGRDLWDEPCESWVELPDHVPQGRYLAVRVTGESMIPLFHTGDVLLVSLEAPIERDRIVLARMPDGGYAAKQVGRLTQTRLELVSLNPDFAPVVVPRDHGTVIGTVVLRWCDHEHTEPVQR
jgi:SOS-response transcriptional repressor LexA